MTARFYCVTCRRVVYMGDDGEEVCPVCVGPLIPDPVPARES